MKNAVQRDRPQMTIWHMRIACWILMATNTHTPRLCNTHCFSTAKMITRTRLNITLYVLCLIVTCLFNLHIRSRSEQIYVQYRVIQEENIIFIEVLISVNERKNVHVNMCLIVNGYPGYYNFARCFVCM